MVKRFSQFLAEADYKGKSVPLDAPFKLRDDPDFTHGVYVKSDEGDVKFLRYGKRDKKDKVGPQANPTTTTPKDDQEPKKTQAKYWQDKLGEE